MRRVLAPKREKKKNELLEILREIVPVYRIGRASRTIVMPPDHSARQK
jgi:hypothetical protein